MRRLILLPFTVTVLTVVAAACGSDGDASFETLPPIHTTTSTSTTTTEPDSRRKFYEVKPGDNIADIAKSFQVPRGEIVRLNNLPNDGGIIQIGQILEIPTDVVLIDELPVPGSSSTTEVP